jgi:hypothetical protein
MQANATKAKDNEIFTTETALKAIEYKQANLSDIVAKCTNLDEEQKAMLLSMLVKHKNLFLGKRGEYKGQPVNIEVEEGATPVWSKPYPIALKNREVFKTEVYRQCNIWALCELGPEEIEQREWASPRFAVPKKKLIHSSKISTRITVYLQLS